MSEPRNTGPCVLLAGAAAELVAGEAELAVGEGPAWGAAATPFIVAMSCAEIAKLSVETANLVMVSEIVLDCNAGVGGESLEYLQYIFGSGKSS